MPTLYDVAQESRYAVSTVKKAFSTHPRSRGMVSLAAGLRIMDAAARVGFYPRSQKGKWAEAVSRGGVTS